MAKNHWGENHGARCLSPHTKFSPSIFRSPRLYLPAKPTLFLTLMLQYERGEVHRCCLCLRCCHPQDPAGKNINVLVCESVLRSHEKHTSNRLSGHNKSVRRHSPRCAGIVELALAHCNHRRLYINPAQHSHVLDPIHATNEAIHTGRPSALQKRGDQQQVAEHHDEPDSVLYVFTTLPASEKCVVNKNSQLLNMSLPCLPLFPKIAPFFYESLLLQVCLIWEPNL